METKAVTPPSKSVTSATRSVTPASRPVPSSTRPAASSLLWLPELRKHSGKGGVTGGATFESALDALKANRTRSWLTMLGVIIGVSAVIAVVTLTQGVSANVNASFSSLGSNAVTIIPGTTSDRGAVSAAGSNQTLTQGDANAMEQVPYVVNVTPVLSTNAQVVYGDLNWNTRVSGVYPVYQSIENWQLAEGSWFTDQDEQMGTPVAVLGQTVVENLFPTGNPDPVGQTIRIGNALFRVVGVLQSKGSQGFQNSDDAIFVPFRAAYDQLTTTAYVNQIVVQIDDIKDLTPAEQAITALLRKRHNLPGPDPSQQQNNFRGPSLLGGGPPRGGGTGSGNARAGQSGAAKGAARSGSQQGAAGGTTGRTRTSSYDPPNDFQIFSVDQIIQSQQQSETLLTILLVGIAAISLAVGGVGIMNIMLVSVTERTREIGIRMAIGARRRDIRNQFLIEALMLSAAGGVIGIVIGLAGGFAITAALRLPFVVSPIPALIAVTVSGAVGVIFGLYPATRAAKLDPIQALRIA